MTFLVFDVLRLDGADLTGRTYDERREALAGLTLPAQVQLSPVYPDGAELWEVTRGLGLEGVVAKRRSSTYVPGRRSRDWVKAPHRRTRAALVGGWREETNGSGRMGAVLFGHGTPTVPCATWVGPAAGSPADAPPTCRASWCRARTRRSTTRCPRSTPVAPAGSSRRGLDTLYLARNPTGRLRQPVVRAVRTDTDADPWEQP